MPYSVTSWLNNSTPAINATNLNKLTNELIAQAADQGLSHSLPTWANGIPPAVSDAAPLNEMERVVQAVATSLGLSYSPTVWQAGWAPPRNSTNLNKLEAQAQANRAAIEAVPPVGDLTYTPPNYVSGDPRLIGSYSGLTLAPAPTFAANSGYTYTLNDSTDYFLNLGLKEWSAYNFGPGNTPRTALMINGGRNVVIVGGEVLFHSTNIYDDCAGIRVLGGNAAGTVYIEGVKITSVNGITWSSARTGVIQHCYISARTYQDKDNTGAGGDGNHPDVFQIWAGSSGCSIYMDRVTGYTWYTGFTCLEAQPVRWRRHRTDLHSGTRVWESQQLGNYMNYLSPGNDPVTCAYDGTTNNWMDLGYWGGIREQLQMAIDSPSYSPHLTYIVHHNGLDFGPSSDPNFYRGANVSVGATQGDEWRCTSNANITERTKWGKPTDADGATGGEFAPAAACGTGYVPVGYA